MISGYLAPYIKQLIIGPAFKLAEAILELMLPLYMAKIIDVGVIMGDRDYIQRTGLFMLIIAGVGVLCALVCQYTASVVSQGVGTNIRNDLFKHISSLSHNEIDRFGTPTLINRITNDTNQVQLAVAMLIRLVIRAPFLCIGGLVMAFMLDKALSVIMLIVLPIFVVILWLTMKKTIPLYKNVQKKLDNIALILRENLTGVRVIRAFTMTKYEEERFNIDNLEYKDNAIKVSIISSLLNPLTTFIMNISVVAIIWFGGVRVNTGYMSAGAIIAYINYMAQILAALIVISQLVVIFTRAFASMGRISEVFEVKPLIYNKENTLGYKESDLQTPIVEFRNVSMAYYDTNEYAIHDISFKAMKGETIGIIGGTGSGKSTLVHLIPRFYDTDKGEVLVNGINVKDLRLEELRDNIGIVIQKPVLFSGTIEENIRWGKESATNEEVAEVTRTAQAEEFVKGFTDEYKTYIQKGGVNVSGGQRQRLTIARALVKEPEILILDDSSSALDFATDAELRKAIKNNIDVTTFIISQRASTIKYADNIIVLNDGEMVGLGTHDELYANCEIYREIWISQNKEDKKDKIKPEVIIA